MLRVKKVTLELTVNPVRPVSPVPAVWMGKKALTDSPVFPDRMVLDLKETVVSKVNLVCPDRPDRWFLTMEKWSPFPGKKAG